MYKIPRTMPYPHQLISADFDIPFVVKCKKITTKAGRYKGIRYNFLKINLLFVKIKKKWSKNVTVRQAPTRVSRLQYKAVSDAVDEKVRKSPMAQVANAAAKRQYNLFNLSVGFL